MKNNKFTFVLEITWLIVALLALGIAIHATATRGFKASIATYLIFILALFIYLVRRYSRKK
jgi:hypothetical protein